MPQSHPLCLKDYAPLTDRRFVALHPLPPPPALSHSFPLNDLTIRIYLVLVLVPVLLLVSGSGPPRWPVKRKAALGARPLASTYFICPREGAWQGGEKRDKITCEFLIDTQQQALKYGQICS